MALFKLGIFDFDGTLADTRAGIVLAAQAAFRRVGLPEPDTDALIRAVGLSLVQTLSAGSTLPLEPPVAERLVSEYRAAYPGLALRHTVLFPGISGLISALTRTGVVLAIATSKARAGVLPLLARLELADAFAVVVCDDDVREKKPHPQMVNRVLEQVGIGCRDAVVVGDTAYDVMMGKAASTSTCAVTWGNHGSAELERAEPDFIADSPAQIADVVLGGLRR